jgi:two-component system sensor histidine kinase/response regulator
LRHAGLVFDLAKPFKDSQLRRIMSEALVEQKSDSFVAATPVPLDVPEGMRLLALLVEDNAVNQKVASRLLEKRGCSVRTASNGREALSRYAEQRFDLIFMDIQMPEMNGYEATRAIRRLEETNGTHIPIIALTANAMAADRQLCLDAGMDDYLSKPIELDKLNQIIVKYGVAQAAVSVGPVASRG